MTDIRDIKAALAGPLEEVSRLIGEMLQSDIELLDATNRALLSRSGKQLRPMLSLLAAGAVGEINGASLRYAAASELIHNATLLHDDVVDDARERRGKPTVSTLLNGRASVLLGDFWLVRAVKCILDAGEHSARVIRMFAKTLSDLAEGELLQMHKASSADTTREDYRRIIYCKTASLFESASLSGALSAGATEEEAAALGDYARTLGLAFQIKDDILDYVGGDALGKPAGMDLSEQKITLPLLCALETVSEAEAAAVRGKVRRIADEPERADAVRDFVRLHDGVALAGREMEEMIEKSISCLGILPDSEEKSYLAELARYVGERTF